MSRRMPLCFRVVCILGITCFGILSARSTWAMQTSNSDPYIGVWVAVDNPADILEVSHSTYDNGYTFAKPSKAAEPHELYPAYKKPDGTLDGPSARAIPPRSISYDKNTDTLLILTHTEQPPLNVVYKRLGAIGAASNSSEQVPGMPRTGNIQDASLHLVALLVALLLACLGLAICRGAKLDAVADPSNGEPS